MHVLSKLVPPSSRLLSPPNPATTPYLLVQHEENINRTKTGNPLAEGLRSQEGLRPSKPLQNLLLIGPVRPPRERAGLGAMHVVAGSGRRNAVSAQLV